jgi:hypothetical protein
MKKEIDKFIKKEIKIVIKRFYHNYLRNDYYTFIKFYKSFLSTKYIFSFNSIKTLKK